VQVGQTKGMRITYFGLTQCRYHLRTWVCRYCREYGWYHGFI